MNLSSSDIVYFLFAAQANSVSLFICTARGAKDLDPEAVAARFGLFCQREEMLSCSSAQSLRIATLVQVT